MEVWRDIPEFKGYYQASNLGRIKSMYRIVYNIRCRICSYDSHILKPRTDSYGYSVVNLSVDGVVKTRKVHRLVWEAFNGPIPEGMVINHNDEKKANNDLTNLSILTPKENNSWGTRLQRVSERQINGKKAKPVNQLSLDGCFIQRFPSAKEVQRQLGYKQGSVSNCCNGKYKQAYGYRWEYAEKKEAG